MPHLSRVATVLLGARGFTTVSYGVGGSGDLFFLSSVRSVSFI